MAWFSRKKKKKKEAEEPQEPLAQTSESEIEEEPDQEAADSEAADSEATGRAGSEVSEEPEEAAEKDEEVSEGIPDSEPDEQSAEVEPEPEPAEEIEESSEGAPEEAAELDDEPGEELGEEPQEETREGLFTRFRKKLSKTRTGLKGRIDSVFSGKTVVDEELLEELEEVLITADLGIEAALGILDGLRKKIRKKNLTDPLEIREALKESLLDMLQSADFGVDPPDKIPEVILIVGVNGVGKTTTVGKLARRYILDGKKVLLAAGDTFRAAAGEQLEIWAERTGADIVRHQAGADPSAVVFDALDAALARDVDVVLVDTAGRLHTRVNLMEELKKVRRIMDRKVPGAPHQTLLVLDGTTGQNAISQAKMFNEATPLTGLIITKLDGTAKGGIVIAVSNLINRPVLYVGLGEQMDDLNPFDPEAFVAAVV